MISRMVATVRGLGRARLAYESTLAVLVAGSTAGMSLLLGIPVAAVLALAVIDLVLVAARKSYPMGALVVFSAATLASGRPDGLLLVVLSWSAGYRLPPGRLSAILVAAAVCFLTGSRLRGDEFGLPGLAFSVGIFLCCAVVPAVVARMSAQRRAILDLLHERTIYLAGQQRIIAEQARVREATRIAREMHDSLGHRLTLLTLYAGALKSSGRADTDTLDLLYATSRSAIDELRHILVLLRDESSEEPQRTSLAQAGELVTDARSAGAEIELTREGEPIDLPAMVEHAAYRTLQEGVTNALRHARGGAVRLALRYEEGSVVVEVVNGPGRPHEGTTSGQGLYGLAERVRLAGGVLYHGPEPDGGYRIAATLPLTQSGPQSREPWSSEQPVVVDDVGEALRRRDQRRRAWVAGMVMSVLALGILCAGGFVFLWLRITVDSDTYQSVRVGESETAARAKLPPRSWSQASDTSHPGCTTYPARLQGEYRFCFRDGTLISKETVDVGS